MNNNSYEDSLFIDYLYKNASADYISAGGPPDPIVRNLWISNQMSNELDWYNKKALSIQTDIKSNPRFNEIQKLVSR